MALVRIQSGPVTSIVGKLPTCHTCKMKKVGLFTVDANGRPICADCTANQGRPITDEPYTKGLTPGG